MDREKNKNDCKEGNKSTQPDLGAIDINIGAGFSESC